MLVGTQGQWSGALYSIPARATLRDEGTDLKGGELNPSSWRRDLKMREGVPPPGINIPPPGVAAYVKSRE